MASLCMDLISEILFLLPVKSLLRFRSVSKSWCSLLSDPYFVKSHLECFKSDFNLVFELVKYNQWPFHKELRLQGMDSLNFLPHVYDYPFHKTHDNVVLRGSCNGLICFTNSEYNIVVGNMLINDYHVREVPSDREFLNGEKIRVTYGFGYDSIHDDYKVVRILSRSPQDSSCCNMYEVLVYSLRYDRWSEIGIGNTLAPSVTLYGGLDPPNGVFLCTALHWLAESRLQDGRRYYFILSFDLSAEYFHTIPLPCDIQVEQGGRCLIMSSLGGCLCVTSKESLGVRIWVMRNYMAESSWTKLFLISNVSFCEVLKPLGFSSSGDKVLFQSKSNKLCWYDSEKQEFQNMKVDGMNTAELFLSSMVSVSAYKATRQGVQHQGLKKDKLLTCHLPIPIFSC
ncbi:hypothetical protein SLE2022_166080 [Rubroshorea leprosula]